MPKVGDLVGLSVDVSGNERKQKATHTAAGAISIKNGTAMIGSGGALAMTLARPLAGEDDGKELVITAITAFAHTVTNTTPGFNKAGAAGDVATFGGAIGDSMRIIAANGVWNAVSLRNVTLG